jgi:hypothetical protein
VPGVPPSGVGPTGVHVPFDAPVGITHGRPVQQSAVVVHVPPLGTHAPRQTLFTHGLPQQSALVAQVVPAGGGFAVQSTGFNRQRGIPSASLLQQLSGLLLQ